MKNEPVVTQAAILAVITNGIALAVGFGWHLTEAQSALIVAEASSILAVIFAVVVRSKVTPTDAVNAVETGDGAE